jgi:hypothetical protein
VATEITPLITVACHVTFLLVLHPESPSRQPPDRFAGPIRRTWPRCSITSRRRSPV